MYIQFKTNVIIDRKQYFEFSYYEYVRTEYEIVINDFPIQKKIYVGLRDDEEFKVSEDNAFLRDDEPHESFKDNHYEWTRNNYLKDTETLDFEKEINKVLASIGLKIDSEFGYKESWNINDVFNERPSGYTNVGVNGKRNISFARFRKRK